MTIRLINVSLFAPVLAGHSVQARWQRGGGDRDAGEHGFGAQVTGLHCALPLIATPKPRESSPINCCCAVHLPIQRKGSVLGSSQEGY